MRDRNQPNRWRPIYSIVCALSALAIGILLVLSPWKINEQNRVPTPPVVIEDATTDELTAEEIAQIYGANSEEVDAIFVELGDGTTMREAVQEWINRNQ